MKHARLNAERRKRFNAANSEHDLLTHAHLEVAAVKLSSNQSVLGVVFRNIGVQEIKTYPSNAQFPEPGKNLPIQNRYRNQRFPVATKRFTDWKVIKILVQIDRCLNAVLVNLLPEIAMPIEQTDRNEIQIQIARRFAMVSSEYTKAAGIIRDRFVKTKLS